MSDVIQHTIVKLKQTSIYILGFILCSSIAFQGWHYIKFQEEMLKFVSIGPRFTAINGQKLCESIKRSDEVIRKLHPNDFIDLPELECNFLDEK